MITKIGIKAIKYAKKNKIGDEFFDRRSSSNLNMLYSIWCNIDDFVQDTAILIEESVDDENGISYDINLSFSIRKNLEKWQPQLKKIIGIPLIFGITGVDGKNYVVGTNDAPAYLTTQDSYNKISTREMNFSVQYKNLDGLLDKESLIYEPSSVMVVNPNVVELSWKGGLFNINVATSSIWNIIQNRTLMKFTTASKSNSTTVAGQCAIHTGRTTRTDTIRLTTDGNETADVLINQTGKAEFVSITDTSPISVAANATSFSINAKSNSSKITASFVSNGIDAKLGTITVNGSAITNGTAITGDPGAEAEYDIIVNCTCGANSLASVKSSVLILTDNAGHTAQITINQAAAESTISVDPATITAPSAGGSFTITVTSNDNWNVEIID